MRTPDAVSRYASRVYAACAVIAAAALASGPLWAWGRPDRMLGFLLGAAASVARFAWSVRLARRFACLSTDTAPARPSAYAAARLAGLLAPAAALAVAGLWDGADLAAACAGVFVASAGSVAAAVVETRSASREEVAGPPSS